MAKKESKEGLDRLAGLLGVFLMLALGAGLAVAILYQPNAITAPDSQLKESISAYGAMGDYFGGILNPIFAFLSFMALLFTIYLQSDELRASRKELELSKEAMKRSASAQEKQAAHFESESEKNEALKMISIIFEEIQNIMNSEDRVQKIHGHKLAVYFGA